ncbi:hypothetical protein ACQKM9_17205 [Viridibacillus sp. NPDC093762]|uniref:PBECR3 domain-containing polyvalent protein n=1 Tax=Viridibacillus sp. NPDC093762 TaxID=3390720 RepID=UPI003CFD6890
MINCNLTLDRTTLEEVIEIQRLDYNNLTVDQKLSIAKVMELFNKPLKEILDDSTTDLPYRICRQCDKVMNEGYVIDAGDTYCSDACLHVNISQEEYLEMYDDGEGDSYYTTWDEIIIDPQATDTQLVGVIPKCLVDHYSLECVSFNVFMPPGVLKHLVKRGHWSDFMTYYQDIPDMIANPDYAGQNPKEPNSVEIYKVVNDHVILPIKLNKESGLFLSSFFILNNGTDKIQKRLRIGRIHPFSFFIK